MTELGEKNLFMAHNHIELEYVEADRAVFKLDIRPESKNPYGMVHGGAIYTLADNATGYAAHSDGRFYVTETSSLLFLRNQSEGAVRRNAYDGFRLNLLFSLCMGIPVFLLRHQTS